MRTVLLSPHVDDEAFATGLLRSLEGEVEVLYATDGTGGLPSGQDPDVRRREAAEGLRRIDGRIRHRFLPLPFYHRGDRRIDEEDVRLVLEAIRDADAVVLLCDRDPKGTHDRVLMIAEAALLLLPEKRVGYYAGAWGAADWFEANAKVPVDCDSVRAVWQAYPSQNPLVVDGGDPRPLERRYRDRVQAQGGFEAYMWVKK